MTAADHQAKALLMVLDGVGISDSVQGNAVTPETMPFFFDRIRECGVARLEASGEPVGLQRGHTGNSEVGHLTIGAGRRVASVLETIQAAYHDGSWAASEVWQGLGGAPLLHLVGLVSDAGVHGYGPNLVRSARLARTAGVEHVYIHAVLDGVDAQAGSAPRLLEALWKDLEELPGVSCAHVIGRRWACDRSGDLDVTRVLVDHLKGAHPLPDFDMAELRAFLAEHACEKDFPCHRFPQHRFIGDGEPVLITNNRADRTRQVAEVFGETNPVYSLVELDGAVPRERVFFPKTPLDDGVEFELRRRGLRSLRIAEQCKFPHVTYFFNGFNETLGEDSVCIPSIPEGRIPEQPEMSIREVTDAVLDALKDPGRRAVVANIANLDQVGHVGRQELAVSAAASVDTQLRRIYDGCQTFGWTLLVTSDHGNADTMQDSHGRPFGSHSKAPVPLVVMPSPGRSLPLSSHLGSLANVAATFLTALDLAPPDWMEPALVSAPGALEERVS